MTRLVTVDPNAHLNLAPNGIGPDPSHFLFHFLAHGDSWFSVGSLIPFATTNLLAEMAFPFTAYAVNCARPGDTLAHMVEWKKDPNFLTLLASVKASPWEAILMSAGGNDVIDAAAVPPVIDGTPTPRDQRLFLKKDEWGAEGNANRYLSEEGWRVFEAHLSPQFDDLVEARDARRSLSKGVPIFFHVYDFITPRPAMSLAMFLQTGSWLAPALAAYEIPTDDWIEVSKRLMNRLADIISEAARRLPNVHVVETRGTLLPANTLDPGVTLHWANEIHPTVAGYSLLAERYSSAVVQALQPSPAVVAPDAAIGTEKAAPEDNSAAFPPLFIEPPDTAVNAPGVESVSAPQQPDA
jgi:hypothetical protein